MSISPLDEDVSDARQRPTPSIPENSTPFLRLRHSPGSGFGVFASRAILPGTGILESEEADGPAVYVIYRAFRKEVCAWCFRYDRGRNWKIRFQDQSAGGDQRNGASASVGSGPGPGVVFCREECRDAWMDRYGQAGIEAYAAVEAFIQQQVRSRGWSAKINNEEEGGNIPSSSAIEEAWRSAEEQASLIRSLRLYPSDAKSDQPPGSKSQKQALAQATALPILNTDTLFFLLSGVLCASSSSRFASCWRSLLTLNPSLHAIYTSTEALQQITSTFLHLTTILPAQLLPYVTRENFEAVLARDIGNSFGIWSAPNEPDPSSSDMQEGAEMLGYGIWPIASFFNHSCEPNVARRRVGRRWVFTSAREVAEGEELCISYIRGEEDTLTLAERRKRLRGAWGFECRCVKCTRDESVR